MNDSDRPDGALIGVRKEQVEQPGDGRHPRAGGPGQNLDERRPAGADTRPNVLLVDDQPARLLTYEAILDGVGVNCVRALSGREALHKLLTHTFAVILLDVSMPEMDGFETARFIREHPKFERTPIIFVTGVHVTELDTLRGYAAGAIDYIAVPVVPEILRSKVALLVELHRRRAELEALNHELEATRARLEIEHRRAVSEITARVRSDQQTKHDLDADRAQKEWLKAVVDSMNEEVYFADIHGRYIYANPTAMREFGHQTIYGIPVETIVSSLGVYRPDGTPRPIAEAPPIRALKGEVISAEEHIVRIPRSGQLRHRQVSAAPVRDGSGTVIGSVSVVRDITEQRLADIAVRERDRRTTALLKLSDEFRSLTAPAELAYAAARILGETLGVSRCGYGTIDLEAETISIERDWYIDGIQSLAGVLHFREHGSYIDDLKQGATVVCSDVRHDPRTAATASVLESISARSFVNMPVTEQGGFVALLYLTDTVVRAWPPEDLAFIREVADRTRVAVERRRNEQARLLREQELRDADRRKDEFIALLAHELRNPLVPIRTGVELLKNARWQPELIDTIRPIMERQTEHVVRMIDDLLDVSRITSGRLELRRQQVKLFSVMDMAVESTRAAMQTKALEFIVNSSEPHWVLDVDATRLSQAISNLLQNAVKFTPGGGRIELTAMIDLSAPSGVPDLEITISDSGIGMDEQMLSRLFDLFAQASPPGRGSHSGLGLGLALARRLVEMHGGTLTAHSEGPGRGSEFRIRIPAPRIAQRVEPGTRSETTPLTGIRVMVIDDNHDVADATQLLIVKLGGTAEVAYDGPSALAALVGFEPDVLLLDIGMPGMDGYETCKRVRALQGNRVAVVGVSGWGQAQDKQLAEQAGFDAHLTKPADPTKLAEVIRKLARRLAAG